LFIAVMIFSMSGLASGGGGIGFFIGPAGAAAVAAVAGTDAAVANAAGLAQSSAVQSEANKRVRFIVDSLSSLLDITIAMPVRHVKDA
jgi:hypothetical protein